MINFDPKTDSLYLAQLQFTKNKRMLFIRWKYNFTSQANQYMTF